MNSRTQVMSLVGFVLLGAILAQGQTRRPILQPTAKQGTVEQKTDPTVVRSQNVVVNLQQVRAKDNQRLSLTLFDRSSITLVRDRQETTARKGLIWYGKVAGEPDSAVTLVVIGEVLVGNIMTGKGRLVQVWDNRKINPILR